MTSVLEPEAEIVHVLFIQHRETGKSGWHVDSLVAAEAAPDDDTTVNIRVDHALDAKQDGSVGEEKRIAGFHLTGQIRI